MHTWRVVGRGRDGRLVVDDPERPACDGCPGDPACAAVPPSGCPRKTHARGDPGLEPGDVVALRLRGPAGQAIAAVLVLVVPLLGLLAGLAAALALATARGVAPMPAGALGVIGGGLGFLLALGGSAVLGRRLQVREELLPEAMRPGEVAVAPG